MSGWHPADKYQEEGGYTDFPQVNNITVHG